MVSSQNSQNLSLLYPTSSSLSASEPMTANLNIENGAISTTTGPLGTEADTLEYENIEEDIIFYVVQSGDTVGEIAEMFGVSVDTIYWTNPDSKKLKVGETLIIPPVSGLIHEVVKGDTLALIAKKYSADIEKIGQWNGFEKDSKLSVGQKIIVPGGKIISAPVSKNKNTISSSSSSVFTKITGLSEGKIGNMLRRASGPDLGSYFMRPCQTCRRTQGSHGNGTSVDLGGKLGTPLVATASGKVIVAKSSGYNMGYGQYVVIEHSNGTQSIYGHMGRVDVSLGQTVFQGQQIGLLGNSGRSTGPHLHFEIRGARNPLISNPNYGL